MAEYRNIQTRMWRSDDWFQELPTDARLFWIYLFTNPSARVAGIYRLPTKTMAFECGLPIERIEELKAEFSQAGKAYFERDIVWVVKMRELQTPGKISEQLKTGIDRDVAEIPPCELKNRYLVRYGYPIGTVPIPGTTAQHSTAQNSTDEGGISGDPAWWLAWKNSFPDGVNPLDKKNLQPTADKYGNDALVKAIEYGNKGKRRQTITIRYIESILEGWEQDGKLNGNGVIPKERQPVKVQLPDGRIVDGTT